MRFTRARCSSDDYPLRAEWKALSVAFRYRMTLSSVPTSACRRAVWQLGHGSLSPIDLIRRFAWVETLHDDQDQWYARPQRPLAFSGSGRWIFVSTPPGCSVVTPPAVRGNAARCLQQRETADECWHSGTRPKQAFLSHSPQTKFGQALSGSMLLGSTISPRNRIALVVSSKTISSEKGRSTTKLGGAPPDG